MAIEQGILSGSHEFRSNPRFLKGAMVESRPRRDNPRAAGEPHASLSGTTL